MDILAAYRTDEALEVEGKWFPFSPTSRVKVAHAGNEKFQATLRKKLEDGQIDLNQKDSETEQMAQKVLIETLAETILVGWEGFTEKGVSVPYSTSKATEYLALKKFRERIQGFSANFEAFRLEAQEKQGNA